MCFSVARSVIIIIFECVARNKLIEIGEREPRWAHSIVALFHKRPKFMVWIHTKRNVHFVCVCAHYFFFFISFPFCIVNMAFNYKIPAHTHTISKSNVNFTVLQRSKRKILQRFHAALAAFYGCRAKSQQRQTHEKRNTTTGKTFSVYCCRLLLLLLLLFFVSLLFRKFIGANIK